MKVPAMDFDDEFDDEEPLPAIGTCKALYTFDGNALRHVAHLSRPGPGHLRFQ